MIEIIVYGQPAPQGSKKFVGLAKSGRGILIESSKKVKPWREAVKLAAIEAMGGAGAKRITGPVAVEMVFTVPKPKSAPKRKQTWPDKKPDLSKLVRAAEDSLCDAGVFEDDARIVNCLSRKRYPGEGINALPVPGAYITVSGIIDE